MRLAWLIAFLRRHLKQLIRLSFVALAFLVLYDACPVMVDKHHAHTRAEHLPGFWALFGFVACAVIILVSKWFGHSGIMKREDYYDE